MKRFLFGAAAIALSIAGADVARADFGGFGAILKGATEQVTDKKVDDAKQNTPGIVDEKKDAKPVSADAPATGGDATRVACGIFGQVCPICKGKFVESAYAENMTQAKWYTKKDGSDSKQGNAMQFANKISTIVGRKYDKMKKFPADGDTHVFCWNSFDANTLPAMKEKGYQIVQDASADTCSGEGQSCVQPIAECRKAGGDSKYTCELNLRFSMRQGNSCKSAASRCD